VGEDEAGSGRLSQTEIKYRGLFFVGVRLLSRLPKFKVCVALEALSGAYTMVEMSSNHKAHLNMIRQFKRRAQESLPDLFSKKSERQDVDRESVVKELHAKVGQLTIENDFLSKPSANEQQPKESDGEEGSVSLPKTRTPQKESFLALTFPLITGPL
jgi:transposase